ncbi:MAG: Gfo/Idh/MocA family oxidoreductase [Bryobacterales bacterium]|nr:Gfo/Idh/MocA family oxidoreductase [Bryobacterales bacterium]
MSTSTPPASLAGLSRRHFGKAAVAATALSYSRILGANDRISMGYIGLGNRGDQVHDAFLEHGDNATVAICDLREDYMDLAAKKSASRGAAKRYHDYRKLLEDKNVDAVAICTPDQWHAVMFVAACKAGKDIYCEKPFSLTIFEGRRMVDAAAKYKPVTQVGLHRRSAPEIRKLAEMLKAGEIGKISAARSFHLRNDWPVGIGNPADSAPPSKELWDAWLGPAPMQPYNVNKTFYNFRWFYDFSGGQLTNFGVHYNDTMRMLMQLGVPRSVTALGGKYVVNDNRQIPDTLVVLWEYDNPATGSPSLNSYEQYNGNGAPGNIKDMELEFRGTLGTLYMQNANWEIVPERNHSVAPKPRSPLDRDESEFRASYKPAMAAKQGKGSASTAFHTRNFLDCLKSRKETNCPALEGHLSNVGPLMGNIAHKTHTHLQFDAKTERFTNSEEANKYLHYEYRKGYSIDL